MTIAISASCGPGRRRGFESLTDDIKTTTASGKLFFHIMGALAEFERSLISERTKAGIQSARRRGKHIGRPHRLRPDQIRHAARMIRSGQESVTGMAALLGVDRSTLHRALGRQEKGQAGK